MSEKHIVVQGAICKCQFGSAPDQLKVLSHEKEYANDKAAAKKLIATTLELGTTFEQNSFGSCAKMRNKPCKVSVTEWKGFYENVVLTNGGKILLEDSKAVCPIGGSPCIEIINHGQVAEPSSQNFKNANAGMQKQVNPLVNTSDLSQPKRTHQGVEDAMQ